MNPSSAPVPRPPSLEQLWLIMQMAALMFGVALVAAALILDPQPILPAWQRYTLIAIGVAILPSILAVRSYREQLAQAGRLGSAARTRALQTRLLLGVALADLPALAGFLHAYVSGELWPLIAACVATVVIVYRYRPDEVRAM